MAPSKNTDREARDARDRLRRYNARQAVHNHQSKRRVRDNVLALVGLVVVATLATFTQIYYFSSGPGKPVAHHSSTPTATPTPAAGKNVGNVPNPSVAEARTWTGTLGLNDVKLDISLDGKAAPQAVASFVTDAKVNYFDGLVCWRMTNSADFYVLQCGTKTVSGADESTYSFGPLENTPTDNKYPAGSIVEARTGGNAYGSGHQFFITYKDTTIPADAAGGYTIFGHVTGGLDRLNSEITSKGITPPAAGSTTTNKNDGPPVVATKITSVTIK